MEQYLQFLNEFPKTPYTDSENQKLADFLSGKTEYSDVEGLLKRDKNWSAFEKSNRTFATLLSDNTFTPANNRFIKAARDCLTYWQNKFCSVVFTHISTDLIDFYEKSELGIDLLILDILDQLSHQNHIKPSKFGCSDYAEFFGKLYDLYPQVYEKLAEGSLFATAYLFGRDCKKHKNQGERLTKLDFERLNNADISEFSFAYVMQRDFNNPLSETCNNIINKNYNKAISNLHHAFRFIINQDNECFYEEVLNAVKAGILPQIEIIAYFVNQQQKPKGLDDYIIKNEEAALKALIIVDSDNKNNHSPGDMYILNIFWKAGKHLDKVKLYETKSINSLEKSFSPIPNIAEYYRGETDVIPDAPRYFYGIFNHSKEMYLLAGFSLLPARYVRYLTKHKKLEQIRDILHTPNTRDFINSLGFSISEKIGLLANFKEAVYSDDEKTLLEQIVLENVNGDFSLIETASEGVSAGAKAFLIELVYAKNPEYNPQFAINNLGDSSKQVRDTVMSILLPRKELKEQIRPLLQSKKKAVRESAEKLMVKYEGCGGAAESSTEEFDALAYCIKHIPKSAAKTIAWTDFDNLPKVRMVNSDTIADDTIIRGYIYLIVSQTEMILPPAAEKIRQTLNKDDLRRLGQELYQIWKDQGALAKRRGVLIIASIHGDDAFVNTLKNDIHEWGDGSKFGFGLRSKLAADATSAMALQGSDLALMTVDAMSKKFKNKQVRKAAEEAFGFAAEQLGIDPEVLGDKIVPTLGFNERGEQIIDYGNRSFTAVINPQLQITIKTDGGKVIKSLPAVGVNDDAEKAAKAKSDFSLMKKTLKSITAIQCMRLEQALSCNRTWNKKDWKKLFVENPIMNMFAIGLIWGTYDDSGKLLTSFRYMEDGTFTDAQEGEVILTDNDAIGLCHPLDLGKDAVTGWIQQLGDYEIKQPIEQLTRKVFLLSDKNKNITAISDFSGVKLYAVSLLGKLQSLGWRRGSVEDGAGYDTFFKSDKKQGIDARLKFSGTYIGADSSDEVEIYDIVFFKTGTLEHYSYYSPPKEKEVLLPLSQIPARLYSEICYDAERVAAKRSET